MRQVQQEGGNLLCLPELLKLMGLVQKESPLMLNPLKKHTTQGKQKRKSRRIPQWKWGRASRSTFVEWRSTYHPHHEA